MEPGFAGLEASLLALTIPGLVSESGATHKPPLVGTSFCSCTRALVNFLLTVPEQGCKVSEVPNQFLDFGW
jgi:hypothetical protein